MPLKAQHESRVPKRPPIDTSPTASGIGMPVLEARRLFAGYRDLAVVRDCSLHVRRGEVVALLGPNGAGKTTTVLTVAGVLSPLAGAVYWKGVPADQPLYSRARRGFALVPEQRSVIHGLSVKDNLRLGPGGVGAAIDLFPDLEPLLGRPAGLLSGGEQQILTLARCLASKPSLILVDELSLGLAPRVVERLLGSLRAAADDRGAAVLLVEQQVTRALKVADRYYFLREGAIIDSGQADKGAAARIAAMYLT